MILTPNEYNGLSKVATITKKEWFTIRTKYNGETPIQDRFYDLEECKYMPIKTGLDLLLCDYWPSLYDRLKEEEHKAVLALAARYKIDLPDEPK